MKLRKFFSWKRWALVILLLLALVVILLFFVSGEGSDLWNMIAVRSITSENTESKTKNEKKTEAEQSEVEQVLKIRLEYKKERFYLREYKNETFVKEYSCSSEAKRLDDDLLDKRLKDVKNDIKKQNPKLKTITVDYRVPGEVLRFESDRARNIILYTPGFELRVIDYIAGQQNER